jgi:GNAT superfamily N-acetyltransferase
LLFAPGLPASMFNRAIGLGLRQDAGMAQVDAIVQAYREARCPTWWLHWNPFSTPASLPAMLPAKGFSQPARRSWAKVLHGPEPAPKIPTDLHIAPATPLQLGEVMRAIVTAFEMPPFMTDWLAALYGQPLWRIYAITDGAQVVGGGCLYVSGALAWLGMGAVLPSHRRRGGQGALMARRIADAIEAGARHIVTETGEPIADEPNPSLANMKRCGFVTVASRLNFAGPAQ